MSGLIASCDVTVAEPEASDGCNSPKRKSGFSIAPVHAGAAALPLTTIVARQDKGIR